MPKHFQAQLFAEFKNKAIVNKGILAGESYLEEAFFRRVSPTEKAISDLSKFEEEFPQKTGNGLVIINQLQEYASPATMMQLGGRYFGFVNGSVLPVGLSARLLADFWDQNAALQVISPIAAQLESVVEKWLVDIFDLPEDTAAGFVSGTSVSIFSGLAAARWRIYQKMGWDVNKKGLRNAPEIRIITGAGAHATVLKAISLLGFGTDMIEVVPADDQGRIIVEKIPILDENCILILQAGNVNTGAFDDFSAIFEKIKGSNCWVHIDGAFGLWAKAGSRFAQLSEGIELADSWSADGHKTLNTPYDSGIILCKDRAALLGAFQANAAYIMPGKNRDGMFYTPEMSRRARVVELWATLKYLGAEGLENLVHLLHNRTILFSELLSKAGFEVLNEVVFNQVLIRYKDDETTMEILEKIQQSGILWCGPSKWKGQDVIRISVCSWATTEEDVRVCVGAFEDVIS